MTPALQNYIDPPTHTPLSSPLDLSLPHTTLLDLQQALASADQDSLTNLVRTLLTCRTSEHVTSLQGPNGHPLFLETAALFCWGAYQNNFMIDLQPLLENSITPSS